MAQKLREKILTTLDKSGDFNTRKFASEEGVDHDEVVGVVKSLCTFEGLLRVEQLSQDLWELSEEAEVIADSGSFEYRVFQLIPEGGISVTDLKSNDGYKALGEGGQVGLRQATKLKWLKPGKVDGVLHYNKNVETVEDDLAKTLNAVKADSSPKGPLSDAKILKDLKRRKLINKTVLKSMNVSKGSDFTLNPVKAESELTEDMIKNGSWKTMKFRPLNIDAEGVPPQYGALHPLLKVRKEYREIFLEMGFSEMPTARYVENSFWNFDALFQPQQHPARDAHDTFFMKEPAISTGFPPDYLERVKKVHSEGGYGSQGYQYDWKVEEAQKNILRTHTTAVSARMLYQLAQQKPFKPVKYFSIDRVFRNETLDATHLAEFHQIEGVIADYNLTLGDLMGVLSHFFKRLGMEDLSFKPAYNPYTEPSMEIFSYHKGLNKVVEIGNSGVFRPEMLRPMGLPEDVVVIAWGLSLERPTMIKYGYSNIRDLIGPAVDLEAARKKPIVRV